MDELPLMDRRPRLERVRQALAATDAEALLVTDLANIRYLTGFTGSAAMVLVSATEMLFVADGRYGVQSAEQLGAAGVEATFSIGDRVRQMEVLAAAAAGRRVGIEAGSVTVAQGRSLATAFGRAPVETVGLVERVRRCKDSAEVARIRAAARIAADAFEQAISELDPELTELDLAIAIEGAMRRAGASGPSFDTIVAAGARAALPHAQPERVAIGGSAVVVDWGAVLDGYCSDTTRTVAVGGVGGEVADAWQAVLDAQQAGLACVAAGAPLADVDAACRASLATVGLAEYFTTGTGHGVGLQIHEDPFIGTTSTGLIELGDIVTVEPGVYIPGKFGIRIEDFYVVTEHGPERLSPAQLTPLTA